MRVTVTPGIPQGTVRVPTSKSVAHRYLIAAAFTPGETRLRDLPDNADIRATLRCLRAMGAAIRQNGTGATICGRLSAGRRCRLRRERYNPALAAPVRPAAAGGRPDNLYGRTAPICTPAVRV